MTNGVLLFFSMALAIVVAWCALVWGVPMLARLRFIGAAEEIRDECMDAVLDGQLPDSAPVRDFLRVQDLYVSQSRHLTLSRAAAFYRAAERAGYPLSREMPSYNLLSAAQRKHMNDLSSCSTWNVQRYLLHGSQTGWLLLCLRARRAGEDPRARAEKLARVTTSEALRTVRGRKMASDDLVSTSPREQLLFT